MPSSHVVLDRVGIAFDDERAVAGAGLLLAAPLAERLGIEQAADQLVDLGTGQARPVPAASCVPWSRPWSPAGTASTMWSCCAVGRPAACSAIG
jgi:hypothetical protein